MSRPEPEPAAAWLTPADVDALTAWTPDGWRQTGRTAYILHADGSETLESWTRGEDGEMRLTHAEVTPPRPPRPPGFQPCRVYWGSHGCDLDRGHAGDCECGCCECGSHPDEGSGCVAKPPYYGDGTRFYGEDVAVRGLPS